MCTSQSGWRGVGGDEVRYCVEWFERYVKEGSGCGG
jgi:hypothetical protein